MKHLIILFIILISISCGKDNDSGPLNTFTLEGSDN